MRTDWCIVGLVHKPNISYQFENIVKCWYEILQKSNIEISGVRYQLQYQFKMVLLVQRLYDSDDILMIDLQPDPIQHLSIKKTMRNKYIENIVSVLEFKPSI